MLSSKPKALFFSLSFFICSTFCFGQQKPNYLSIANDFIKRGANQELLDYFEAENKLYPNDSDILTYLGLGNLELRNYEKAEIFLHLGIQNNVNCAKCYSYLARSYAETNNLEKAKEYANAAIEMDDSNAYSFFIRAKIREWQNNYLGAITDYNKAINIEPKQTRYLIARGECYSKNNYPGLALSDFNEAILLDSTASYPYYKRSNIYYDVTDFEAALQNIDEAIKLQNNVSEYYIGRGAVYAAMNENQQSLDDYNKALTLDSTNYFIYYNRAMVLYSLENLDAACADYSILTEKINAGEITDEHFILGINTYADHICNDNKPSYFYQRGIALYNLHEYQKSIEIYTKGLQQFPNDAMSFYCKGNTHLEIAEYEKALNCYNATLNLKDNLKQEISLNPKLLTIDPNELDQFYKSSISSIFYNISQCYVGLLNYDLALNYIDSAIRYLPEHGEISIEEYLNYKGVIYLHKREFHNSLMIFNQVITQNKEYSIAYVNRAIAQISLFENTTFLFETDQHDAANLFLNVNLNAPNKLISIKYDAEVQSAIADCDKAIELNPEFGYAYLIRGQIKKLINDPLFCSDIKNAQKLGIIVQNELRSECGR